MTPLDHIDAMLSLLRPEDLEGISPAKLRRLADGLRIAEQWCRLAERQALPPTSDVLGHIRDRKRPPNSGVLAALNDGERQS